MRTRSLTVAALLAAVLSPSVSVAADTTLERIPEVSNQLIEALKKQKIVYTQDLRQHTAGWDVAKVDKLAKQMKVDQDQLRTAVAVSRLLLIKDINFREGFLLVKGCNVTSPANLGGRAAAWALQCMTEYNTPRSLLKALPDEAKVQAWIDAAKTAAETQEQVAWETTVLIDHFHATDAEVTKKFKKAKLDTNVKIFEKLNLVAERDRFAKAHGLALEAVEWYAAVADLTRLKEIHPTTAHLLWKAGVNGLGVLSGKLVPRLTQELAEANARFKVRPKDMTEEAVQEIVDLAKKHPAH